jgi:hypothetical protein
VVRATILIQKNTPQGGYSYQPGWEELTTNIKEGLPLIEKIANVIEPKLAGPLRVPGSVLENNNKLTACLELRGIIQTQEEAAEILGPGPDGARSCFSYAPDH